jgi:hypothetical protein
MKLVLLLLLVLIVSAPFLPLREQLAWCLVFIHAVGVLFYYLSRRQRSDFYKKSKYEAIYRFILFGLAPISVFLSIFGDLQFGGIITISLILNMLLFFPSKASQEPLERHRS